MTHGASGLQGSHSSLVEKGLAARHRHSLLFLGADPLLKGQCSMGFNIYIYYTYIYIYYTYIYIYREFS